MRPIMQFNTFDKYNLVIDIGRKKSVQVYGFKTYKDGSFLF